MTQSMERKFGPYITSKLMSEGGQRALFSATHETTGQAGILCVMTITVSDTKTAIAQVTSILENISELNIPNLLPITGYGEDRGILYYFYPGMVEKTLHELIVESFEQSNRYPSLHEVADFFQIIAASLDLLHKTSFKFHGILAPDVIGFAQDGTPYLIDVGYLRIARILYRLESTNSFNVTVYSAPELWDGLHPTGATDQYALACIIYQLITGQVPFNPPSIFDLMQAHVNDIAQPPHYIRKDLPSSLAEVFWQALAKEPDKRYPSCMAFHDAFREAIKDVEEESTNVFVTGVFPVIPSRDILLVSQDANLIETTHSALPNTTWQTVTKGIDALKQVQKSKPDLIIAEAIIPLLDGFKLFEALKEDENLEEIPYILIGHKNNKTHQEISKKVGIKYYIEKPFEKETLASLVEKALQKKTETLTQSTTEEHQQQKFAGEFDIFISYSRQDTEIMRTIKDSLIHHNLAVWVDEEQITPGTDSWRRAIQQAIETSHCVAVILSPDAKVSRWVEAELDYARTQGKMVYPILARGEIKDSVPFGYTLTQYVDVRSNFEKALLQLSETVNKHIQSL